MSTLSVNELRISRRGEDRAHVVQAGSVVPLTLILALQSLVSLTTLRNTAFQDEGLYLYAGRQIVHHWLGGPAPLDHYAYYFSGYPGFYPVIGGFLDLVGGLELARAFSLICMLGVTAAVYIVTGKLFGRNAAIFASAAYSCSGVVLFVGRLATFDALCLFLLALATIIALHSATSRRSSVALTLGPVLALAILAKYAALLSIIPIFGFLALLGIPSIGWASTCRRLALSASSFAISLGITYVVIDRAAFHAIAGSTTNRVTGIKADRVALFEHVLRMGGVVYAISLCGLCLVVLHRSRYSLLAVLVFVTSLLMPAYHIYEREPISLDKHIAYGLFFAAPLAGYALTWLSGHLHRVPLSTHRGLWLAPVSLVLVVLTLGLTQSRWLYASWANTSRLTYTLDTQLRKGAGRILAEDIEITRFDAANVTDEWQWGSFYYFNYTGAGGRQFLGDSGIAQAIKDRYFSFVELSFVYLPNDAYFAAQQMATSRNYDLIAVVPFRNSYGTGHFFVWRSAAVPGHGNFTSLAQLRL
jgi:Dolichyl-phosphate-mannose-protein mannosyltransferase